MTNAFAKLLAAAALTAMLAPAASHAVELDPKAVVYQLPDQFKWGPVTPAGNQQAVLFGDPLSRDYTASSPNGWRVTISASRISIPTTASSP